MIYWYFMHFTSSWLTTPWGLVFFWSFVGCGGVKVKWTCTWNVSVLTESHFHLLITVCKQFTPTSVIHYLLNVDGISFKRDPEVTHECTETITHRTMSCAGCCHVEVNMEVSECNVCGFIYTNLWVDDDDEDEDEKKETFLTWLLRRWVWILGYLCTNVNFTWFFCIRT